MSLIARCFAQLALIFSTAFLPSPRTFRSLSGSFSMTSNVSFPNAATIFLAVEGPMPLISPLARYCSMPFVLTGRDSWWVLASNWGPYLGCSTQVPSISRTQPGETLGKSPVTVAQYPHSRTYRSRIDQLPFGLRNRTLSTVPFNFSKSVHLFVVANIDAAGKQSWPAAGAGHEIKPLRELGFLLWRFPRP